MSFANFFSKSKNNSEKHKTFDKYDEEHNLSNVRPKHSTSIDKSAESSYQIKEQYDSSDDREDSDERQHRDDRDDEDERQYRDDRDDEELYRQREYRNNKKESGYSSENEEYSSHREQSIKNLDNFFYKKNIQIVKIFKMKNRCILLLVLMKELGKCVLLYIDPSKYQIECQLNNSIINRENIHDINLFKINHKHIYEVCDCYPELMRLSQEHRVNIENEKNKIWLTHFEQVCIQLNNFKKTVKSSKAKLGIITENSISFINDDNEIELFTISDTNPNKFSKMKTYLVYNLNSFMNNINEIDFEIEKLIPSFIDELNKDNKELRRHIESNSVLNNINSVKSILDKLEVKKKGLMNDSNQLKDILKLAKKNLNKAKNKRENVQQRFTIEKLDNTKQETMYFLIDVEDEYNNILSHTLNMMHLIDKQCLNVNEYIEFIKKYCEFN